MKTVAIRTAATCMYAILAHLGAVAIWDRNDSVALWVGFPAWNIACAALFVYVGTLTTGRSLPFVLPVVFCSSLLQVSTVAVFVLESLGESLGSALVALPVFLGNVIAWQPGLFAVWLGLPVLVAYIMLYQNWARSRVDASHT